jgi:geranylgeranyl diphosphate synthase type II
MAIDFGLRYRYLKQTIDEYLVNCLREQEPRSLYQPMAYVLAGGGKRIRPVLVILACEAVGGNAEAAVHAGAAMEILHNFTLVHDDIMDNAGSRRGRRTVHTKWDGNVAILTGDALLALAYRVLLQTESPRLKDISQTFTEGVLEVCEGQAYDKEFEARRRVSLDEYLLMIQKKTGRMVTASTQIGALIGNSTDTELDALMRYGDLIGRAFQIQDDLLDIVGDERKLGKKIGGDVQEGKKTFLLLEALRRSRGAERKLLTEVITKRGVPRSKVPRIRAIYHSSGAVDAALERIRNDIDEAKQQLRRLRSSDATSMLHWFSDMLLNRKS